MIWCKFIFIFSFMHKALRLYLSFLARMIVRKHKPYIIGVTGTVGKTTMTQNIAILLRTAFWNDAVEISKYNYNGEFWLPLSIIGSKTGGKNLWLWAKVWWHAIRRYFHSYPRYLILEYGIDTPWEMDFLLSIAHPDIAIITPVEPNHIEQFQEFSKYKKEKLKILAYAKKYIVHESLRENVPVNTPLYGFSHQENMQIQDIHTTSSGTSAQIVCDDEVYTVEYPSIGTFLIENLLPIIYISQKMKIPKEKITQSMKSMIIKNGRWKLLEGINWSVIIDGSYNGWSLSIRKGLESLSDFLETKKITLVLWDMRELGWQTQNLHDKLADDIIRIFSAYPKTKIYLVWPYMKEYVFPKLQGYFDVKFSFSSRAVGEYVKSYSDQISEDDMFYVKGSQNTIFLEEAIKYWISPDQYKYLPRQWGEWDEKKQVFFSSVRQDIE